MSSRPRSTKHWTPERAEQWWRERQQYWKVMLAPENRHPINKPTLDERVAYRDIQYEEYWHRVKDLPHVVAHQMAIRREQVETQCNVVAHFSAVCGWMYKEQ